MEADAVRSGTRPPSSSKRPRIETPLSSLPSESTLIWKEGAGPTTTGSVLVKLAQNGFTREAHKIIELSRTASLVGRKSDGGLPELWDIMGQRAGKGGITRLMAVCITRGSLSMQRAKALIEDHNADVMASDDNERTALHLALGASTDDECWDSTPINDDLVFYLLEKDPRGTEDVDDYGFLPLHWACTNGAGLSIITELVRLYKDSVKALDALDGHVALHTACSNEASHDVIKFLFDAFPDAVHMRSADDDDAIAFAAANKEVDAAAIAAAIAANDDDDNVDRFFVRDPNFLPLHLAFHSKVSLDTIKLLCEARPRSIIETRNKMLPLHFACCANAPFEVTEYIFKLYPEGVKRRDWGRRLCLHIACKASPPNVRVIKMLLDAFPESISLTDKSGSLPLHLACSAESHNIEVIKLLLQRYPESVKEKTKGGLLPLALACNAQSHDLNVIKFLHDAYPAAIKEMSTSGLAIHQASSANTTVEVIDFLINSYRDSVSEKDNSGSTPLHRACGECSSSGFYHYRSSEETLDRSEIINLLIKNYPDGLKEINYRNQFPLHVSCGSGYQCHNLPTDHFRVIEILLKAFPESVKFADNRGRLAIHYACKKNAPLSTIKLLVDAYPDCLKVKDDSGSLPLHYSLAFGGPYYDDKGGRHVEIIHYLINSYPGSLRILNTDDQLPLHRACVSNVHENILKLLIESYPSSVRKQDINRKLPVQLFEVRSLPFDIGKLFRGRSIMAHNEDDEELNRAVDEMEAMVDVADEEEGEGEDE